MLAERAPFALLLSFASLVGCGHKEERFESVAQITRMAVVERDSDQNPTQIDVEMEWDPCPGDQLQMVRGGAEFAKCMERYKIGDYVPVKVVHLWDTHGFYTWDLEKVGDCPRPLDREAAHGSWEKSQECHPTSAHGREDGFLCDRRPFNSLVDICPWTGRD